MMFSFLFKKANPISSSETTLQAIPENQKSPPLKDSTNDPDPIKKCQCAVYKSIFDSINKNRNLPRSIYDLPECKGLKLKPS